MQVYRLLQYKIYQSLVIYDISVTTQYISLSITMQYISLSIQNLHRLLIVRIEACEQCIHHCHWSAKCKQRRALFLVCSTQQKTWVQCEMSGYMGAIMKSSQNSSCFISGLIFLPYQRLCNPKSCSGFFSKYKCQVGCI